MKRWRFIAICAVVPVLITLDVIGAGIMRQARSLTLIEALVGTSITCVCTLVQVYRLRADQKTALMVAAIFVMAAGSTLLAVDACP